MSREQQLNEAQEAITELVDQLEEVLFDMPIKTKVKDIFIAELGRWHGEVNDALTLTPTDW